MKFTTTFFNYVISTLYIYVWLVSLSVKWINNNTYIAGGWQGLNEFIREKYLEQCSVNVSYYQKGKFASKVIGWCAKLSSPKTVNVDMLFFYAQ